MQLKNLLRQVIAVLLSAKSVLAVQCYDCTNTAGNCVTGSCSYGLFGCMKTVTYTGGIEPDGSQSQEDKYLFNAVKACMVVPFSGVEGCNEVWLVGSIRQVTCYCNTDYCNTANSTPHTSYMLMLSPLMLLAYIL